MSLLEELLQRRGSTSHEQLQFELDDLRLSIPWEGRTPRSLTRVGMSLFSRREPQKSVSDLH